LAFTVNYGVTCRARVGVTLGDGAYGGEAGDGLELIHDEAEVVEDVVEGGGGLVDHTKLDLPFEIQRSHHGRRQEADQILVVRGEHVQIPPSDDLQSKVWLLESRFFSSRGLRTRRVPLALQQAVDATALSNLEPPASRVSSSLSSRPKSLESNNSKKRRRRHTPR
jgi:hypothetical protein